MTGPSLKKRDSHASIHEAALNEAKEITVLFCQCLKNGEKQKALQVVDVLIEHWELRTLAHAQMEEEGLYPELQEQHPEWEKIISNLKRDHDLMRGIVERIKERQISNAADEAMVKLLHALIIIDEIHNETEMRILPYE